MSHPRPNLTELESTPNIAKEKPEIKKSEVEIKQKKPTFFGVSYGLDPSQDQVVAEEAKSPVVGSEKLAEEVKPTLNPFRSKF